MVATGSSSMRGPGETRWILPCVRLGGPGILQLSPNQGRSVPTTQGCRPAARTSRSVLGPAGGLGTEVYLVQESGLPCNPHIRIIHGCSQGSSLSLYSKSWSPVAAGMMWAL